MTLSPAGRVARSTPRPHSGTAGPARRRTLLRTSDGVPIDAVYESGAAAHESDGIARTGPTGPSARPAFVVAHGFTGDADRPHVRRVAGVLASYGAVVTFSFRGHGASGGRSTVGDREVRDLAAAVAWARELGHRRVATVGFSMGGSVVLRQAALYDRDSGLRPDAVVSVSAPARWYYRGTAPMRRLHWLVTRPGGRLVSRYGLRTRVHHRGWDPVPLSPVGAAARIAPTPLLVVHGEQDAYFPVDHPRMLAAAAGDHGELWLEPAMGHAEHAATDALLRRIGDWAAARAGRSG
ncbi:alpha/beta fold hydrolase [Streptomyces sp. NPDC005925]|uniref:alpha/beta hydrolase family protein n=1 Tax=Streptomyces sp. NPDC005925 TaxID=3157172 RepID=UPI0033E04B8A